jgi:hypothetical protein
MGWLGFCDFNIHSAFSHSVHIGLMVRGLISMTRDDSENDSLKIKYYPGNIFT